MAMLVVLAGFAQSCSVDGSSDACSTGERTGSQSSEVRALVCPVYNPALLPAPPADGPTVGLGAPPGQFGVNASGDPEYSLRFDVPPGPPGLTPSVGLEYRAGSSGVAGTNFALTGFSAITRCPKTMARDQVMDAVHYDGKDNYCLDGKPLGAAPMERLISRHFTRRSRDLITGSGEGARRSA